MWDSKLVNDAIFFATKCHEGQVMKNPVNMPYSAHFFGSTMNAVKLGALLEEPINWDLLICTAILHDTLEDTIATYEDIKGIFGQEIADAVSALTKNESLPFEEQMIDCIKRIKKQPKEVAIVKISDRLFNIRDRVPSWDKERQEQYKQESKLICDELGQGFKKVQEVMEEQIAKY